jgi:hypothetical protein
MTELFDIPETKSPRLIWMDRHGIKVIALRTDAKSFNHWMAYRHEGDFISASAYGPTEDDAITSLAVKLGLRLWNEEGAP